MNRLIEPTKDYISFSSLLFELSRLNSEPIRDVVRYLECRDLELLKAYDFDMNFKVISPESSQDDIKLFLEDATVVFKDTAKDWVFRDSASLSEVSEDTKQKLLKFFNIHNNRYFKISDLISFEPLNGLMCFEDIDAKHTVSDESIDNPIDREIDQNDQNYISALKYVNDLGKGIGSGKPLKITLGYLVNNISFNKVKLYLHIKDEEKYVLVSQTDSLDYTTSIELLEGIYHSLDDSQRGINFSDTDLESFKGLYFEFAGLPDLRSSDSSTTVPKQIGQNKKQLSVPRSKPLKDKNQINDLGENQKSIITFEFFTAEDITRLIIDYNPVYINQDHNYLRYYRMVGKAIDAGSLIPDEKGDIPAIQVKEWLAKHNFIYKGFNDNLSSDSDKIGLLTLGHVESKTYEQLAKELEVARKTIEQKNKDIQSLEDQKEIQQYKSVEDKELAPNSQAKVTHMLYAILKEHGYDLSPPKGKGVANDQIVAASRNYKSPVTRNFVSNWLERVHQLDLELNK